MSFIDLTGQVFGRLTVIERAENSKGGKVRWLCRCECGVEKIIRGSNLTNNRSLSCGCLNREVNSKVHTKHGLRHTKVYKIWAGMMKRCYNKNCKAYSRYGGRNIKVCERWHDVSNFYEDVSKLEHFNEPGYSLDRIDNNKGYEPDNMRWATRKEQNRNTRRNALVDYNGELIALSAAAELTGINYAILWDRYHKGERGEQLFRKVKE